MSLRSRLFLFFGGFIALLVAAQWWLMESLARELAAETDRLAMAVGASVAQVMSFDLDCDPATDPGCPERIHLRSVSGEWSGEAPWPDGLPLSDTETVADLMQRHAAGDGTHGNRTYSYGFRTSSGSSSDSSSAPDSVSDSGAETDSGDGSDEARPGPTKIVRMIPEILGLHERLDEDALQNMVIVVGADGASSLDERLVVKYVDSCAPEETCEQLDGLEALQNVLQDRPVGRWVEQRTEVSRDGKTVVRLKRVGPDGKVEETEQVLGGGPDGSHVAFHAPGTQVIELTAGGLQTSDVFVEGDVDIERLVVETAESVHEDLGPHGHGPPDPVEMHDDTHAAEHGLGGHGREVFFRLARDGGSRFLTVEQSDRVSQVPIPQANREALERFQTKLWLGSGLIVALGLLAAAWLAHRVSTPLRDLSAAATEVGDGAFGTRVEAGSGDREIRNTVQAFNSMSSRLAELDAETRRLEALRHMGELGDVARGLAHTLRNPLNALGLSVEELAARSASAEATDEDDGLVESARRQIRRIDRGIRSFLLLASQSGGAMEEAAIEEVDIAELVRDVALEALQDNPGYQLELHVEQAASLSAVEAELRAVVQALVVNALEASPSGGVVDVRLDEATQGDGWVLRVDDQGPGLAPEIRRRLFTPHLSTKANGSGMGLFLAHRIASHRYGGRLDLLDLDEGGTRAELKLRPRSEGGQRSESGQRRESGRGSDR